MDSTDTSVVSLGEYVRIARQRWFVIGLGLFVGMGLGLAWYLLAPRQYEGNSVVTISPITEELFSSTPVNQLVNTATESAIVRSGRVAERAAEIAGLEGDVRELQERVSVAVPLNSLIMEISFRASTAESAAAGANAFAESYLEFRAAGAERRREAFVEGLLDQLDEVTAAFEASGEDSAERQTLEQRVNSLQQQISQTSLLTFAPGQVITFAQEPRFPISPRRLVAGTAGLVLGVLFGLAAAGLAHRMDDRVVSVGGAERLAGRRATGVLPAFHGYRRLNPIDRDEIALSVNELRRITAKDDVASWLVLRADAGERTPAEALAWELATHESPLLLRHPRYPGFPAPSWAPENFLAARGVKVVTASGRQAARAVTTSTKPVIVDTCGADRYADALALSSQVDTVVLCVELGRTRQQDLERARTALERSGISVPEVRLLVVRRTPRLVAAFRRVRALAPGIPAEDVRKPEDLDAGDEAALVQQR